MFKSIDRQLNTQPLLPIEDLLLPNRSDFHLESFCENQLKSSANMGICRDIIKISIANLFISLSLCLMVKITTSYNAMRNECQLYISVKRVFPYYYSGVIGDDIDTLANMYRTLRFILPRNELADMLSLRIRKTCDERLFLASRVKSFFSPLIACINLFRKPKDWTMPPKRHVVSIIVEDIENAFHPVSELLHSYAQHILLRVGYPMRDWGASVIFLIMELNIADMGAFSGKLGQIPSVKVKTSTLKIEKGDINED